MLRRPAIFALLLAAIALLGTQVPAQAHLSVPAPLAPGADLVVSVAAHEVAAPVGRVLAAAPEVPGLPWLAILGAVIALAVGSRRPRHALALALVLLLTVFAFEDGLHSVHHGFDPGKAPTCSIAAAAQHVSAAAVDHPAPETILPAVRIAVEGNPFDPASRFLCPDQGRGPPLHSV